MPDPALLLLHAIMDAAGADGTSGPLLDLLWWIRR